MQDLDPQLIGPQQRLGPPANNALTCSESSVSNALTCSNTSVCRNVSTRNA